jgi:hypothetical protein
VSNSSLHFLHFLTFISHHWGLCGRYCCIGCPSERVGVTHPELFSLAGLAATARAGANGEVIGIEMPLGRALCLALSVVDADDDFLAVWQNQSPDVFGHVVVSVEDTLDEFAFAVADLPDRAAIKVNGESVMGIVGDDRAESLAGCEDAGDVVFVTFQMCEFHVFLHEWAILLSYWVSVRRGSAFGPVWRSCSRLASCCGGCGRRDRRNGCKCESSF